MKTTSTLLAVALAAGLAVPALAHDPGRYRTHEHYRTSDVRHAQERLAELGYPAGKADGVMGTQTHTAIRNFQRDKNLNATGELDDETRSALDVRAESPTAGTSR